MSDSRTLHPTTAAVYRFIIGYKEEHAGDSPSRREIAEKLDVALSIVHYHMVMLERAGLVTLPAGRDARRLGIPGAVWTPPAAHLERKDGGKVGERWGVFEGV